MRSKFQHVLFIVFMLSFTFLFNFVNTMNIDEGPYEALPADEICDKCNCTSENAKTNSESEKLFSIDCSLKTSLHHMLREWPKEMGENHSDTEIIFTMSMNYINILQPLPATNAKILFICRHCHISKISPHTFVDSPNILSLDLAYNELKGDDLDPEIFRGPENDDNYAPIKLETLRLCHNKLNYLDSRIFEHTPNLKILDLSYNYFESFDDGTEKAIRSLHNLEILDLSHTHIMEVPSVILENMSKLKEISLNGNNLLSVPESLISVATSLQFLHLSENPIEVINSESFGELKRLEFLNISDMSELTEIKENSFQRLHQLEYLICKGNKKLETFHMEHLRDLIHLKQLDISNNALTTLNFGEIESEEHHERNKTQFKQLRLLKLAGNPWNCDCKMITALEVFDHSAKYFKKSHNNDAARCGKPYDLTSKLLYDLPIDYVCATNEKHKEPRIKIYEPPQFLRPKSIMLTVFSVVGVVILGIIIGFLIVCIKRKLKPNDASYSSSPIRYTTVRNSTISNAN